MSRLAALVWLALLLAAAIHVGVAFSRGLPLDSDIMALLPAEKLDPAVRQAEQSINASLSRRIVVLLGHADPATARQAAARLEGQLRGDGLLAPGSDIPDNAALQHLGTLYFPARDGLLAEDDRQALLEGRAGLLTDRALAQIFGFSGFGDGRLLAHDPFLLFPAFLASLPLPSGHAKIEEGRPVVAENGTIWVAVTGLLTDQPTSLSFQRRFGESFAQGLTPGVKVLRLGTVFFASAGAGSALKLSSIVGAVSLAGTALLLLAVFRSPWPLLLGVGSIAAGLIAALSACLLIFGTLHVAAQLFGASLIGIAADYSLLYFAQIFSPAADGPARLKRVLAGITLGMVTTVIGYLTLALSPFPGLHQVAVFSAIGLLAAYLSVLLWFPLLDRAKSRPMGGEALAGHIVRFWSGRGRIVAALAGLTVLIGGYATLKTDDDVRHQQALDPVLTAEQSDVERLLGYAPAGQFFLVEGENDEQALQREEALADRLKPGMAKWMAPASFVPSLRRQSENRALRAEKLDLPDLVSKLGMPLPAVEDTPYQPITLDAAAGLPFLPLMRLGPGRHIVLLQGITDLAALRGAADGLPGIRFVDPAGEISTVLTAYRERAVILLILSLLLMAPLVAWRYGLRGILPVLGPPAIAILLTPALLALIGLPFTFFSAIGLVLALSMGVDYAVFCAEDGRVQPVTIAGITLAMSTAVLSFGLLAISDVEGMRTFGAAILTAVPLAWLLAPLASAARKKVR